MAPPWPCPVFLRAGPNIELSEGWFSGMTCNKSTLMHSSAQPRCSGCARVLTWIMMRACMTAQQPMINTTANACCVREGTRQLTLHFRGAWPPCRCVHDAHADRMCARRRGTSFRKSYGWGYAVVSPAAGVAPSHKDGAWRFEVVVEAATGTHSPALTSVRAWAPPTYIALVPACTPCTPLHLAALCAPFES
jgi:hypothetical protein